MSLGAFLGKKLREKGVTLYFLSKATHISYAYLLAIEKGQRKNPSYDKIKKIALALDITTQEILEAAGLENSSLEKDVITQTVNSKAPQRIPIIPWSWFIDPTQRMDMLAEHEFRNFCYTELKSNALYAIECGKALNPFLAGTTLIVQPQEIPKHGSLVLIKDLKTIGIYRASVLEKEFIAVPFETDKPCIKMASLSNPQTQFKAVIRESICRY